MAFVELGEEFLFPHPDIIAAVEKTVDWFKTKYS